MRRKRPIQSMTIIVMMMLFMMLSLLESPESVANTNQWANPATVTRVTEATFQTLIDPRADGQTEITERINGVPRTYVPDHETYHPDDRQWQGLPSMVRTGDRLWAVWYTGGTGEPRQFNYLVVAYSEDNGQTWVDPFLVLDHQDPNHDGVSLGVPNLFIDMDGNLSLIWIQYYTWIVRFHDADASDINDVTWDEPVVLTSSKIHKPPTVFMDSDGTKALILASEAEAGDTHIDTTRFYVSKNKGETWSIRSSLPSSSANNRLFPESQITQTTDGSLIVMSRLEKGSAGGIEIAYSNDFGHQWESYENNLEKPFIGPGSKFHIMTLPSGNILIINHNTTSSRSGLVAYLSTDNGETFPYELPIDLRSDVTYPYAFEKDGVIYAAWDKGRFLEKEIRFAMFTEEDIMAGDYVTTAAVELGIVSKLNPLYKEITSVNDAFDPVLTFPLGTLSQTIRDQLPTTITVTDNTDVTHTLNGTWKSPGYYQDVEGTYRFYFQTDLPMNVADTYDVLSITVRLVPQDHQSSTGIVIILVSVIVLLAGASALVIRKRGKKE